MFLHRKLGYMYSIKDTFSLLRTPFYEFCWIFEIWSFYKLQIHVFISKTSSSHIFSKIYFDITLMDSIYVYSALVHCISYTFYCICMSEHVTIVLQEFGNRPVWQPLCVLYGHCNTLVWNALLTIVYIVHFQIGCSLINYHHINQIFCTV